MLLLTTPAQHAGENPAVELNPKRLKKWIAQLPVTDVISTVKVLHQAIRPFNELRLDYSERIKLLEVFHQAFDEILFFYDDLRLRQLPIAATQRKSLAEDVMWLYLELATGYKIIAKDAFDAGRSPKRDSTLLLAMYRAMELVIYALLYAYRGQQPAPPLSYLEINQLYLAADLNGVLTTKVRNVKSMSGAPSIDSLYKQFLLLTVANPYKLNGGEIYEYFSLLGPFVKHCVLDAESTCALNENKFFIDLMDDAPPKACEFANSAAVAEFTRVLDVAAVVSEIKTGRSSGANSGHLFAEESQMLQVLAKQMESQHGSLDLNAQTNKKVKATLGFELLSQLLADESHINAALLSSTVVHGGIEVRDVVQEGEATIDLAPVTLVTENQNTSVFLTKESSFSVPLVTGEVMAWIDPGNTPNPSLALGLIRWLNLEENHSVKIEVEKIPGSPTVTDCTEENSQFRFTVWYFPKLEELAQSASLFLEKKYYETGKFIYVSVKNKTFKVQLGSPVLESDSYVQTKFIVIQG